MRYTHALALVAIMLLTACSTSHRPVYSGREESTDGVPGFVDGKKVSPHVKLGQSYTVDGETYVPRNQPDYVEEGMASWYGPGFHGGKTANGERFNTAELTGAHRTLPLPSIVRVTMVSTGKQVYVRINDRGPFARSRIIDLSRAAADKIGLLRAGVAKVRVEYMPNETRRFVNLLAEGRDPKSIDLASEVLNYGGDNRAYSVARADTRRSASSNGWRNLGTSSANAAEVDEDIKPLADADDDDIEARDSAPVDDVSVAEIAEPKEPPSRQDKNGNSPFAVLETAVGQPPRRSAAASLASSYAPPAKASEVSDVSGGSFVQLGAFMRRENADRLRQKYSAIKGITIIKKPNAAGQMLYHVRVGPHGNVEESEHVLSQLKHAGAEEAKIIKE